MGVSDWGQTSCRGVYAYDDYLEYEMLIVREVLEEVARDTDDDGRAYPGQSIAAGDGKASRPAIEELSRNHDE